MSNVPVKYCTLYSLKHSIKSGNPSQSSGCIPHHGTAKVEKMQWSAGSFEAYARTSRVVATMRGYQKHIFRGWCWKARKLPPDSGEAPRNCLVLLPTGMGKTLIAVGVVEWFLGLSDQMDKIVCVLAPTVVLAEQQAEVLRSLLEVDVVCLHGSIKLRDKELWDDWEEYFTSLRNLKNYVLQRLSEPSNSPASRGASPVNSRECGGCPSTCCFPTALTHIQMEDLGLSPCCDDDDCSRPTIASKQIIFNNKLPRVFVMTPQVLVTKLASGELRYSQNIGLLIIDEAHHCSSLHPVNDVLLNFHHRSPTKRRPFLLGLSASPIKKQVDAKKDLEGLVLSLISDVRQLEESLDSELLAAPARLLTRYSSTVHTLAVQAATTGASTATGTASSIFSLMEQEVWVPMLRYVCAQHGGKARIGYRSASQSNSEQCDNLLCVCWNAVMKQLAIVADGTGVWGMLVGFSLLFDTRGPNVKKSSKNAGQIMESILGLLEFDYEHQVLKERNEKLKSEMAAAWNEQKDYLNNLMDQWLSKYKLCEKTWRRTVTAQGLYVPTLPSATELPSWQLSSAMGANATVTELAHMPAIWTHVTPVERDVNELLGVPGSAMCWASLLSPKLVIVEQLLTAPGRTMSPELYQRMRECFDSTSTYNDAHGKHPICEWCLQEIPMSGWQSPMEAFNHHKRAAGCELRPKAIVFCRARITTFVVDLYIKLRMKTSCPTKYVIGGRGCSGHLGRLLSMNGGEQVSIIQLFRIENPSSPDFTQALISTEVLAEGLDVPNCNLIVRFDLPQTPAENIQSRGRARKTTSLYVSILTEYLSVTKLLLYQFYDDFLLFMSALIVKENLQEATQRLEIAGQRLGKGAPSIDQLVRSARNLWIKLAPHSVERPLSTYVPYLYDKGSEAFIVSGRANSHLSSLYYCFDTKVKFETDSHFSVKKDIVVEPCGVNVSAPSGTKFVDACKDYYSLGHCRPHHMCDIQLRPFSRPEGSLAQYVKIRVVVRNPAITAKKAMKDYAALETIRALRDDFKVLASNYHMPR
eukprot:Lankesteria_metandrocarpae@DN5018_c0_g1_i1.p1